jgi:hypothetical protein
VPQLSLFFDMLNSQAGQKFQSGRSNPRPSARVPSQPGFARGATGSLGSQPFRSRNPNAGIDKERQKIMESPVMQAFTRIQKKKLLF